MLAKIIYQIYKYIKNNLFFNNNGMQVGERLCWR